MAFCWGWWIAVITYSNLSSSQKIMDWCGLSHGPFTNIFPKMGGGNTAGSLLHPWNDDDFQYIPIWYLLKWVRLKILIMPQFIPIYGYVNREKVENKWFTIQVGGNQNLRWSWKADFCPDCWSQGSGGTTMWDAQQRMADAFPKPLFISEEIMHKWKRDSNFQTWIYDDLYWSPMMISKKRNSEKYQWSCTSSGPLAGRSLKFFVFA